MAVKAKKPASDSLARMAFAQPKVTAAAVALVIVGATYFLAIGPLLDQVAAGHAYDPAAARYGAERAEAQLDAAKETVAAYGSINAEYRDKAVTALPSDPATPAVISAIDSLTVLSGLQLTSLDVTQAKDPLKGALDLGVLNIAMNVTGGGYPQLKGFLTSLERDLRLTDVLAVSFNPQNAVYQLSARSYYLRRASSGAAVSASATAAPAAAAQ